MGVGPKNRRELHWSTDAGHVSLAWPIDMTPEDASDAVAAVGIALRQIQRVADAGLPFEDYDAAMKAALKDNRP